MPTAQQSAEDRQLTAESSSKVPFWARAAATGTQRPPTKCSMSAGPVLEEEVLKRSPTAQQSLVVKQVTPASEVIDAPGTPGVLADQVGPDAWRRVPADAGTEMTRPPATTLAATTLAATAMTERKRDTLNMASKIKPPRDVTAFRIRSLGPGVLAVSAN